MTERTDIELRNKIDSSISQALREIASEAETADAKLDALNKRLGGVGGKGRKQGSEFFDGAADGAERAGREVNKLRDKFRRLKQESRGNDLRDRLRSGRGLRGNFARAAGGVGQASGAVRGAAKEASDALEGLNRVSGRSANALFDLVNIIQDAPYGFRAIANNIPTTARSFQLLAKDAGGARGAISGILGLIPGFAKIGLGVAAVAAPFILLRDRIKLTESGTVTLGDQFRFVVQGMKDDASDLTDSITNFIDVPSQVSKLRKLSDAYSKIKESARNTTVRVRGGGQGQLGRSVDFLEGTAARLVPGGSAARSLAGRLGSEQDILQVKYEAQRKVLDGIVSQMERENELARMTAVERERAVVADRVREALGREVLGTDEIDRINPLVDERRKIRQEEALDKALISAEQEALTLKRTDEEKILLAIKEQVAVYGEINDTQHEMIAATAQRLATARQETEEKRKQAQIDARNTAANASAQQQLDDIRYEQRLRDVGSSQEVINVLLRERQLIQQGVNEKLARELSLTEAIEKRREEGNNPHNLNSGQLREIDDFKFRSAADSINQSATSYLGDLSGVQGYFNTLNQGFDSATRSANVFGQASQNATSGIQSGMLSASNSLQQFSDGPMQSFLGQIDQLSGFGAGGSGGGGGGLLGMLFGGILQGIGAGARQRSAGRFASYQHASMNNIQPAYYMSGGFTRRGLTSQVDGFVHRNEYVANARNASKYQREFAHLDRTGNLPLQQAGSNVNVQHDGSTAIQVVPQSRNNIRIIAKQVVAESVPRMVAGEAAAANSRYSRQIAASTHTRRRLL